MHDAHAPQKQKAAAPADGDAMEDSSEEEEDGGGDGGESSPTSPCESSSSSRELVTVTPYRLPNPGPYPQVRSGQRKETR